MHRYIHLIEYVTALLATCQLLSCFNSVFIKYNAVSYFLYI